MLTLGKQPLASPRISTVHTSGPQWRPNSPSRQAVRLHHLDHLSRAFACNRGLLCFTMMLFCTSPRQPKQRWQLSFFQLRHLTSPHLTSPPTSQPAPAGLEPSRPGTATWDHGKDRTGIFCLWEPSVRRCLSSNGAQKKTNNLSLESFGFDWLISPWLRASHELQRSSEQ